MKYSPNTELILLTVHHICDLLTTRPITLCAEMYDHLSSVDLVDSYSNETELELDLSFGSDYYWKLATSKTLREKDGSITIHTRLGGGSMGGSRGGLLGLQPTPPIISTVQRICTCSIAPTHVLLVLPIVLIHLQ